jgi:hypothetical protein
LTTWRPPTGASLLQAAGAVAVLLAGEAIIALQISAHALGVGPFLLVLLGLMVAGLLGVQFYALYSLMRTYYCLDSDRLTIVCGAVTYIVPLETITNVVAIKSDWQRVRANLFPLGYPNRNGSIEGVGEVKLVAPTFSPANLVLISTADRVIALSPRDRGPFIDQVNIRRTKLEFRPSPVEVVLPRFIYLGFLRDRLALALFAAGLLGNLAVLAYVSYRFPSLPPLLPLHYNAIGEIDFIGTRAEAFKIPAIGTVAVLADTIVGIAVHARERVATYILLGAAIAVQFVLLVAVVKIIY